MGALRITMMAVDIRKCFKLIFEDDTFRQVDLFNPKPKRSRRFFALIYDFLVFTDSVFKEVEEREEKVMWRPRYFAKPYRVRAESTTKCRIRLGEERVEEVTEVKCLGTVVCKHGR
ncbi:uncharacterized protein LOC126987416 [Eriocheir sinensis]|uniref:uncharacterized protein LOC126987416 n=1 Tax=Eriocheir sinensis TaxID=95602 RepID=UPI0021C64E78|nr:uncharacterized protein LOC126987416 [Eriocheir sinensis]